MVKIAVAGGSGRVATEIINALAATKKHEILIISRKEPSVIENIPGISRVKVDYSDKASLTSVLADVHTVLSFVGGAQDPGSAAQKNLIDAAVLAGVQRFAPSEWSSSSIEELPWYAEKEAMRTYLQSINKDKKILEYCLFQPGLFTDSFAPPGSDVLQSPSQELWIDFTKRRAIILEGKDCAFTLTTARDLANVVVRAIDYAGEWPVIGGIRGTNISGSRLLEIGTKLLNGQEIDITTLKEEDVRADNIKSWIPKFEDPSLTAEQSAGFSRLILKGVLLSGLCHSWVVSDEWNRLLPDYKFEGAEEFLEKHWAGKA